MKYKIVKKSEYNKLIQMKLAQGDSIRILDDQLNKMTAHNVELNIKALTAREEARKMSDKLKDANAEIYRLRAELNKEVARNRELSKKYKKYKTDYQATFGIFS